MRIVTGFALLFALFCGIACDDGKSDPLDTTKGWVSQGSKVRIYFKCDALGMADRSGVGPLVDKVDQIERSIRGVVTDTRDGWIAVRTEHGQLRAKNGNVLQRRVWISLDAVLAIETDPPE